MHAWYGVVVADGRVEELDLEEAGIAGAITPRIGDLVQLRNLDLADNRLSGSIPAVLGDLPNLAILHLHENRLPLPAPDNLTDPRPGLEVRLPESRSE
ncbi:leucine-rich repeat domain-containing protein [Candidatus Poriferisodalis sp.]|uniref:leucine-rich repeat domain-containing protein n=1 Tax=Candidatus Poriferisodalis sp. TaxID=3101277 RepID=UPI003AF7D714